ncbi:hypothetical protein JJB61_10390 [Clostridium perfringens]|uniref:Uncharacterized protein n=1 Tax=Clostridium perfringens TaxID=1502 RepID=A0AB35S2J8_CLOPF|nr:MULTISPECIES: hypothetical protein [Clostridium]ASY52607.1 hypothetical protein BG908_13430 [Clostridium perfringens]AWS24186.1 hypothetical protein CYK96_00540 [Clostridium perfringens]EGT0681365.1 hypothetical protein [Clostridium perfringens]EJT6477380.1 hypothetical protein [Clostridium perfringens]MBO3338259.1 hypothetical protein [Clostridium perfringens]
MATLKDFATKYANEIYIADDKFLAIENVKLESFELISNGKPISTEELEELWTEIEKQLNNKVFSLYENQNRNFLNAVSLTLKDIKRRKSSNQNRSK